MPKQLENRSGKMLCIWLNQSMDHHQLYTTILKCTKNGLGSNKSTKHVGKNNNSHFIKKMKDTDQDESDDRIDPYQLSIFQYYLLFGIFQEIKGWLFDAHKKKIRTRT